MFEIPLAVAALDFIGNERNNAANASQAANQMAFQQRNSDTAHQREVADLKAAGLNPILSARYGGSSTPGGAMAVMSNSVGSAARVYGDLYSRSLEGERNPSQIELAESQADLNRQRSLQSVVEIDNIDANTRKILYEVENLMPQQETINQVTMQEKAWMVEKLTEEVMRLIPSNVQLNQASAKQHELQAEHLRAKLRGLLIEERIDTTAWAGFWRYIARMVKGTLGSIINFGE